MIKKWLILNRLKPDVLNYRKYLQSDYLIIIIPSYLSEYDFSDYDEVYKLDNFDKTLELDILAKNICNDLVISGVIAMHERDLIRADILRRYCSDNKYSLNGFSLIFRNKYYMKKWLTERNINVPSFCYPQHPQDLLSFIEDTTFPIVVKPVCGSSSIGIKKLESIQDVECFYQNYLEKDVGFLPDSGVPFIFEDWIEEGNLLHADGIIDNNKLDMLYVSEYFQGCNAYREGSYTGSYLLTQKDSRFKKILKIMIKVAENLSNTSYIFHAEFFADKDDISVCEIALRPAGALVPDMIMLKSGVDLRERYLLLQIGSYTSNNSFYDKKELFSWIAIPKPINKKILKKSPTQPPFSYVHNWDCQINDVGQEYIASTKTFDYAVSIIFTGKSKDDIFKHLEEILSWVSKEIEWE